MKRISIIIPAYNEKDSIQEVLNRSLAVDLFGLPKEIIVVDDGSTDGTREILQEYTDRCRIIFHETNKRLTQSMMTGFRAATGDIIVIQHSDLEYHPEDWPFLVKPILDNEADMVMGSRYIAGGGRHFSSLYETGSRILTWFFSMLYLRWLTDIFTAHRAFTREIMESFIPKSEGFSFETEITAQVIKAKKRTREVAINYTPRDFSQGKKLRWTDGFSILFAMLKNRFSR